MRVLLLSGYDAASHKRWRQALARQLPECHFTQLALPARHFSWRIRGSSLSFAYLHRETLAQPYDVVLATSMVDLSALRGFVPSLGAIPTVVYFHENQFAYPASAYQTHSLEPQIVSLYAALAADAVAFNSNFNRRTFLHGAQALLKRLPDQVPAGLPERIDAKSQVLPVPLEPDFFAPVVSRRWRAPWEMLWNHRWEYDKNPALLLRTLELLEEHFTGRLPFTLHVVGQQFRRQPKAFAAIKALLQRTGGLGAWGYQASPADYKALLDRSHIVLSTAEHDFQGLSVLEAVARGCLPVVPAHQAYPEWFGEAACYPYSGALERDAEVLSQRLLALLDEAAPAVPSVQSFSWAHWREGYGQLLAGATNR